MEKMYSNPNTSAIPVYADSAQSQKIGRLFAGSSCQCIGEENGLAIILYKVSIGAPVITKVGFADPAGLRI